MMGDEAPIFQAAPTASAEQKKTTTINTSERVMKQLPLSQKGARENMPTILFPSPHHITGY